MTADALDKATMAHSQAKQKPLGVGRGKLVLFGLLPGDADRYITGGAFKGQRGLFTRDRRGRGR